MLRRSVRLDATGKVQLQVDDGPTNENDRHARMMGSEAGPLRRGSQGV